MVSYCVYHTRQQEPNKCTWPGWTREACKEWGTYIHMAVPSMVMICECRGEAVGAGHEDWLEEGGGGS